jgi:hypothetical protein
MTFKMKNSFRVPRDADADLLQIGTPARNTSAARQPSHAERKTNAEQRSERNSSLAAPIVRQELAQLGRIFFEMPRRGERSCPELLRRQMTVPERHSIVAPGSITTG